MFAEALLAQAKQFLDGARAQGLRVVTAESCTGGLIAGLLTEIPAHPMWWSGASSPIPMKPRKIC